MINEEYGLVLAGGGTKGAFQVGVWKALNELNIKITAIAGVSIGAINGAFFLQNDISKVENLYKNIAPTDIMELNGKINEINKNIFAPENLTTLAVDFAKEKGLDNKPLRELLEKNLNIEEIYNSRIDFGILTYAIKDKKPLKIFKSEMKKEKIIDYILASSCFPIFKPQVIDGVEYLDGGLYDNIPVNILTEKGYKNIIVADISGVGVKKKFQDKSAYIRIISPSEDLGGTFEFDHERINKNMKLGYLDTMKKFNKLEGHIYYFKINEFIKMMEVFNLNTIYGLEYAAQIYGIDKYKIYDFEEFIQLLSKKHKEAEEKYSNIKDNLNIKKMWNYRKQIDELFDKGLGLCFVKDLYMDNPLSSKMKAIQHYFNDYLIASKAIIEMINYLK